MKAIVYLNDGSPDVLKLEEIDKPTPGADEVLIKVRAASVNPIDSGSARHPFLRRILFAMSKSKVNRPGRDVAGQVEAVGLNVTEFKPGVAIFGLCAGAFAEYAIASQSALVMKPDNASFEQAAAVPLAGLTALQGLRDKGKIQPQQKILINGAAGGVGTFAVQIAKSFGAEVTGVCSTRNVEMVRSIGADHVIDYTREDFTKSGQHYDLIFDLVANHSFSARRRVLNPKGIYIGAGIVGLGGSMVRLLAHQITELVLSRFVSQKFVTFMTKLSKEDLVIISELIEAGRVTPVIDRCYSLSEVPDAIRYLEDGHARGKVVVTIEHNNKT
ncbi:MAG: NAD(P)-dependent alcohol dehydrogenase [Pyrinomonadaceae bacterium]